MSRRRFPPGRTFELVEVVPRSEAQPLPAADPVVLAPVPWGTRDPALARMVCEHIVEATPPIVIPFNPRSHARVRGWLVTHRIHH